MLAEFDQERKKASLTLRNLEFWMEYSEKYLEAINSYTREIQGLSEDMFSRSQRDGLEIDDWSGFLIQYLNDQAISLQEMALLLGGSVSEIRVKSDQLERSLGTLKREIDEDLEVAKRMEIEQCLRQEKLRQQRMLEDTVLNSALYNLASGSFERSQSKLNETIRSVQKDFQTKNTEQVKERVKEGILQIQKAVANLTKQANHFKHSVVLEFHERLERLFKEIRQEEDERPRNEKTALSSVEKDSANSFGSSQKGNGTFPAILDHMKRGAGSSAKVPMLGLDYMHRQEERPELKQVSKRLIMDDSYGSERKGFPGNMGGGSFWGRPEERERVGQENKENCEPSFGGSGEKRDSVLRMVKNKVHDEDN